MEQSINLALKNLVLKDGGTLEELTVAITFKCEPDVAEQFCDMLATIISKVS